MLHRHDKYPIRCARVHDAIGADALHLRASTGIAHQGTQRAAVEFSLFDLGRDPSAVGSTVRLTRISPFSGFAAEPVGALQAAGGASFGDHRSGSEGFAHVPNEPFGLRFLGRHLAQQFKGCNGGRQQHDDVAPLAWINAAVGWARSGERRHLATVAGAVLLLALGATLAAGV